MSNEIDVRIAAARSSLDATNADLATLAEMWNFGNPVNHSAEMRTALWQRIVTVRAVVYEAYRNAICAANGIPASDYYLYVYDPVTDNVRYIANG
jgi:hypothetical protein